MSDAYDMIDRFLRNNLGSDDDYAEYSKALDSLCGAQPAQAGQVLTRHEQEDLYRETSNRVAQLEAENRYEFASWFFIAVELVEQAVRVKLGAGVPMTDAQMLAAFAVAHPQDHADMQDDSPANAVERIGARNVYRRFERGIRAAERHHGIAGEKGGA